MRDAAAGTPMMRQYREVKARHPNDLVFFRLGDFYELFEGDAREASRLLGLTLTSRQGVPMAGVPAQQGEAYLRRLLAAGRRVAICEQLEDPETAVGMLRRDVVRVVTPGTLTEEAMLSPKVSAWLAAVHEDGKGSVGLAWADCSTGEFRLREVPRAELLDHLARIGPAEVLVDESRVGRDGELLQALEGALGFSVTPWGDWAFGAEAARSTLLEHFRTSTLAPFGCEDMPAATRAAGALVAYLRETQREGLAPFRALTPEREGDAMPLDRATLQGLEILEGARTRSEGGSLLSVLDRTETAMGGRLLRAWLSAPLARRDAILERHEAVAALVDDPVRRRACRRALAQIYDLQRLASRVASGRATARDALAVARSLQALPALQEGLSGGAGRLASLGEAVDPLPDLAGLLERALHPEPPLAITEGGILRDGFDPGLDRLRTLLRDAGGWIARFEEGEARRTGIASLKVSRHRVFGYLIDVTNAHRDKVPPEYVRRQTLKNAERYTTAELSAHEEACLRAEREAHALEYRRFQEIRERLAEALPRLRACADAAAEADALASLAEVAQARGYVRPEIVEEPVLEIREGRHPVLDAVLHPFVPNDVLLEGSLRGLIVTGPNMAGKSTFIRQAALLVLMAQAGSFVPARSARIGVADRVFARAGAADDLARGQSTFMLEMSETAHILRHATRASLAVLDEIGRGTSTYDGVAIAWAVGEALAVGVGARTLLATHYHELAALAGEHPAVLANATVAVREEGGRIAFLHRIVPGSADRSYGLHVAALAGVPSEVVQRARALLAGLERRPAPAHADRSESPSPDLLHERLQGIDTDRLTPLEALALLAELKRDAKTPHRD